MSEDMVERVARQLARADGGRITGPTRHKAADEFGWDANRSYMEKYVEKHWREHVTAAHLALTALRDPTADMIGVGLSYANWPKDGSHDDLMRSTFGAMIDAALTHPVQSSSSPQQINQSGL